MTQRRCDKCGEPLRTDRYGLYVDEVAEVVFGTPEEREAGDLDSKIVHVNDLDFTQEGVTWSLA